MRGTAGFLKFLYTIGLIFEVLLAVVLAAFDVMLLLVGSFSGLVEKYGDTFKIEGGTLTPAEMDALKPFIMVAIAVAIVSLIFTIFGTLKMRKVLGECKEERPFSDVSVNNLKTAAILTLVGGVVGVASSVCLNLWARELTVAGTSIGSSSMSFQLSFVIDAIVLLLFYQVTKYGQSLEERQ